MKCLIAYQIEMISVGFWGNSSQLGSNVKKVFLSLSIVTLDESLLSLCLVELRIEIGDCNTFYMADYEVLRS